MLPDYLVKNLEDLEITSEDYEAIRSVQESRGVKAILKTCVTRMLETESALFSEHALSVSETDLKGLLRERRAYYAIADLIMNPPIEEKSSE